MQRKRVKRNVFIFFIVLLFLFAAFYVFHSIGAAKERAHYEETGQILWVIETGEEVVALMFDDGPHPKYTREVPDSLGQHEAKRTEK